MVSIDVTDEEVSAGILKPEKREQAIEAILNDGFVVLNDIVDCAHLDLLHDRMLTDVKLLIERADAPFNWNTGNVQQDPPPFPPYLFRDILVNEIVISVTTGVLGSHIKNTMYGGNTAMPGEHRQPVHADTGHLWPRLEVAHPPVHLVVNIPTVDVSAENGSTEIWPGTHKDITIAAGKDIKVPVDVLERRREVCPPIQPAFRRGAVLIRDMRLWHAGMPNRTDRPRPMIAMVHVAGWLETGPSMRFPRGQESFLAHPHLTTCASFIDGPIDHISAPHGYEYVKG